MADNEITRFRRYPQLAQLVRAPEESGLDWKRRVDRERKRLQMGYAQQMGAPPKPPVGGKKRGDLTDEESAVLAKQPGEDHAEWRKRYQREIQKRWRSKKSNKDKELARKRELYLTNGEYETKKQWRLANPEKSKEYNKRYFDKNKEARLAKLKVWADTNPDRVKEVRKQYAKENPHIFTASQARIRAQMINARPIWVDNKEIEVFYREAKRLTKKTGIEHQVDHIVPLNGKNVCGLHVPWNLRVITKEENMKKRNRLDLSLLIDAA